MIQLLKIWLHSQVYFLSNRYVMFTLWLQYLRTHRNLIRILLLFLRFKGLVLNEFKTLKFYFLNSFLNHRSMIYDLVEAWVKAYNDCKQILYNSHIISSYKTSSLVLVFSDTILKLNLFIWILRIYLNKITL